MLSFRSTRPHFPVRASTPRTASSPCHRLHWVQVVLDLGPACFMVPLLHGLTRMRAEFDATLYA